MKETAKFLDINDILGHSDSKFAKYYKKLISSILKIDKINAVFTQSLVGNDPLATLENAIRILNIDLSVHADELQRIPPKGPAIVIANHPTGIADAIIILKTLLSIRKDIKILANHWLLKPNCFNHLIIPVDLYNKKKRMKPVIEALHYLENDYLIFLFPAGEVSTYNLKTQSIDDKNWSQLPSMLSQKLKAPIIPVHIAGQNNLLFYLLGRINPSLRTSKLPSSLFNKNNLRFHLTVGNSITAFMNNIRGQETNLLYNLTYALPHVKNSIEKNKIKTQQSTYAAIQNSQPMGLLTEEINAIPTKNCLLQKGHYSVYLVESNKIPHALQQIGIERERAFRAANMGTGKTIDIDCYDDYYQQLFIWDHVQKKIAGGYRLRLTTENDLNRNFSVAKSYFSSLYHFDHSVKEKLPSFLEMGRSFVTLDYQKNKILLSLLLKGIAKTVIRHLDQVTLATGLVSFSLNSHAEIINKILLEYLHEKSLHAPLWLKKLKPKEPYKHRPALAQPLKKIAKQAVNMIELEKQISYLFNERIKFPSLFKLYESMGVQIGTISIDKEFSNCIDVIYFWNYANSDFERLSLFFEDNDLSLLKKNFFI